MTNQIKTASESLKEIILSALGNLIADSKLPAEPMPPFKVEIPADKSHGDFATNVAMVSAKTFRMPPRKIAELICEALVLDGTYFNRAEIAGPGFIIFSLTAHGFPIPFHLS